MCIQILTTEIIPKNKYSSYTETDLIEQARRSPDCTLLKIRFIYKGQSATGHILVESRIFSEPQAFVDSKIKKILLGWAKENFYKIEPYGNADENQKIIYH